MNYRSPMISAAAVLALGGLIFAACGDDSDDGSTETGVRTVEVEMRDIEFSPDYVEVDAGETVRFVFHNQGSIVHDAFIGDEAAQNEHEMEMRESGGDSHAMDAEGHDDEGGITVEPGATAEFTHSFDVGDELLIGCHEPGHYEAGMVITVEVR